MRREPSSPASKCKLKLKYLKQRLASLLSPSHRRLYSLSSHRPRRHPRCPVRVILGITGPWEWACFARRWMWNVRVPFRWRVNPDSWLSDWLAKVQIHQRMQEHQQTHTGHTYIEAGLLILVAFIACERMSLLSSDLRTQLTHWDRHYEW